MPAKSKKTKPKKAAPPGADAPTPPRAPQPAGLVAAPPPVEYRGTLPLARLRPSPTNPRKTFDEGPLAELAASIGSLGLLQPLLVRPVGPAPRLGPKGWEGTDWFEVIAGERRFRALQLNGAAEAAVTVRLLTDAEVAWVQLVENDQREDVRPSERAAAYAALAAAGQTAEQIAAATGVGLSAVRDLVRLAKLPAWALAAVDRGVFPVATAALVARVPGEQARARAAACVMLGYSHPDVSVDDMAGLESPSVSLESVQGITPPLSYREAKTLLAEHFTRQLKGSPFSLKMTDLVPAAGSCDACPKRAGNDPEAKAEGVRADVCLDPDCYRAKVDAYEAHALKTAWEKHGVRDADLGVKGFDRPPRGWCDLSTQLVGPNEIDPGEIALKGGDDGRTKTLDQLLKPTPPQKYLAFGKGGKAVTLAKTPEVRRLLQGLGVLKRPDAKPKPAARPSTDTGSDPAVAATDSPKSAPPLVTKVSAWQADERAAVIAANVLREYGEEQVAALDEMPDAAEGGPVRGALELVARAVVYDLLTASQSYDTECVLDVLKARFPAISDLTAYHLSTGDTVLDPALAAMTAPQLLGLLLQLTAALELGNGPRRETGKALLDWADLDWGNLTDQVRRELAGGPTADERLDAAEAAQADAEKAGAA